MWFSVLALLVGVPPVAHAASANVVTVGVLSKNTMEITTNLWKPTFGDFLQEQVVTPPPPLCTNVLAQPGVAKWGQHSKQHGEGLTLDQDAL